jgi:NADPH-dependent 2,4-dienoyl-CoA reductase/sulfur reductase-like enzyme
VTERLVVVGGDAAGMSAASPARRRRGPDDLEIVAFERGSTTSYSACGIPYWIGDVVSDRNRLISRHPATFRDSFAIDVRIRTEVEEINLDRREVRARGLETGSTYAVGFDALLVGTGSVPVRPPLPGIHTQGVYGVQVLDGDALRAAVEAGARRAVVVGAGYIGIELAEALTVRGLDGDAGRDGAGADVDAGPEPGGDGPHGHERLGHYHSLR